jgi:hypothetical protein
VSGGPANLYRIHGLLVESEIPLRGCRIDEAAHGRRVDPGPDGAGPVADYRVLAGEPRDCPRSPPPGRILAELRDDGVWTTEDPRDPGRRILRYAGFCDVTLDSTRRTIIVHRASGADPEVLPIFLEGSILAHALAADGLLTLHASAVEVEGQALAIVGGSGAGKSTLAALLCGAGARLVADDALRVDPTGSGATCFPGSRGLRLRPAAASLGSGIEGALMEETVDGRTRVLPPWRGDGPLELRAVLVPELSREAKRLRMRRLGALDALQELLRYPRLAAWRAPEPIRRLFELTAEVSKAVTVYRGSVPWGPPFPPGLADELLAAVGLGPTAHRKSTGTGPVSAGDQQGGAA